MPSSLTEYNEAFRSCRTSGVKPGLYVGQVRLNRMKLAQIHGKKAMSQLLGMFIHVSRSIGSSLAKQSRAGEDGKKGT
jgi:hypothetical protein